MTRVWRLLRRLRRDQGGAVALMLALSLIPLTLAGLGAVDIGRAMSAKSQLQDALDAAALAGLKDSGYDAAALQANGVKAFKQNLVLTGNPPFTMTGDPTFSFGPEWQVQAKASASFRTILIGVFTGNQLTINVASEIRAAADNLETSIVLDVTGSMSGDKISALKDAASNLVDLVVSDVQTPYYSKAALIPYSAAVNVGGYADKIRGTYVKYKTCSSPGCAYYTFTTAASTSWRTDTNTLPITTCVTERTGSNAYTDVAPSSAYLGPNYAPSNNPCLAPQIVPLTSNKTTLKNEIAGLSASGSTAGHIGVAWGWYMVSPNFGYLWPSGSQPAAYGTDHLVKVVVLMTDGEFNTPYRNGVISSDAPAGSGDDSDHINLPALNGSSLYQAAQLCTAMKAKGIIIYTVGFELDTQSAKNLLTNCATDPSHLYLPESGAELKNAFAAIGADISRLRISR